MCVGIHFANLELGTTCPKPPSSPLVFLFAPPFHILYPASPNFCPAPPPPQLCRHLLANLVTPVSPRLLVASASSPGLATSCKLPPSACA